MFASLVDFEMVVVGTRACTVLGVGWGHVYKWSELARYFVVKPV